MPKKSPKAAAAPRPGRSRGAGAVLRGSDAFLEALIDRAAEGICVCRAAPNSGDLRFTLWNPRMVEITGYTMEEINRLGFLPTLLPEPAALARALERMSRLLQGQDLAAEEWEIVCRDGQKRILSLSASALGKSGGAMHILGLAQDATERRQAERQAREAELRYRAFLNSLPQTVFEFDLTGRFTFVNDASLSMFGATREDVERGLRVLDFIHPDHRQAAQQAIANRLAMGDQPSPGAEFLAQRKDGSTFPIRVYSQAIREDGRPKGIRGILVDVTEIKSAEKALRRAREELEAKVEERTRELREANARLRELDQVKSAFLSSASHELRTPLTSVLGFAKLIAKSFTRHMLPLVRDDEGLEGKARLILENLDVIVHEGERLTRLVNDLLDLNKIESGAIEWQDEPVDLSQVIGRAAKAIDGQLKAKPGVALKIDVPPDLPGLNLDRDRIEQVLVNLLDNAAKLTVRGHIRIAARMINGPGVEVRVEDTGPGVPEADRERIFEKFYQARLRNPDSDKPKGTGLGLAICRQIVDHYGGRIWVESEEGRGSTFLFTLPAA